MSFDAFKCRLVVVATEHSPGSPQRPCRRLHYDFFARQRGGEGRARRATPAERAAADVERLVARGAAKLASS